MERECLAVIWAITKFRPYIEGYHFRVITDHSSLRWLHSLHSPTGRLARWVLELQGHSFEVEHQKGAHNHVPDALSRMFKGNEDDAPLAAVDVTSGTEDTWYLGWCDKLQLDPETYLRWKLTGGQLFYYRPDELVDTAVGDAWKIVIPEEFRQEVLAKSHDDPTACHAVLLLAACV